MDDPNTNLSMIDAAVSGAFELWDLPNGALAVRINVSENVTYRIDGVGQRNWILRVHRPNYHSSLAIQSEIDWINALQEAQTVRTPKHVLGRNGEILQMWDFPDESRRHLVLFEFEGGEAPSEDGDLSAEFRELGAIAARTHLHSMAWQRPKTFQRLSWDLDAVYGSAPHWGDWRDAPYVTPDVLHTLEQVERLVRSRLTAFGRSPERYGLIHADMRLANLILSDRGTVLIDFDDCGFGWHLYDFAAAISFLEDHPQIPALKRAWLAGYRSFRALPETDAMEIDSFIMLRRMALLAWIGSHINAPEPQALAADFAADTATLGARYLEQFS